MKLHEKFLRVEEELNDIFVEREEVLHGLALAILSENNMLLLGPPGVGKSMAIREWRSHIEKAVYYEWLLTKFSTPEEVFGPLSLKALEEDRYSRITTNKIPEAHFAFLDEIFKCNSGLLNSLLPVLNERVFHNDGVGHKIPLLTVIGASNEIPDTEDGLEALYDRFLLKFMVKPIQEESNFKKMITGVHAAPKTMISLDEIEQARKMVNDVEINEGMADILIKVRRVMKHQGIHPSDRTYNTATRILKAEAFLNGRDTLEEDDFDVLRHVLWTDPKDERVVWSTILDEVAPERGKILGYYEDAMEVANEVLQEKDVKKKFDKGIDTAAKVKEIKRKVTKLVKQMGSKKKDTKEVKKIEIKINELLASVLSETLGIGKDL